MDGDERKPALNATRHRIHSGDENDRVDKLSWGGGGGEAIGRAVKTLRLLSVCVALGAIGVWLATGANRGWTKTLVEKLTLDPITGIEGISYEKRFVPGLDFLGASMLGAALLAGVSLLLPAPSKNKINT